MVNIVAAQKPLLLWAMKLAGLTPLAVEIEPGSVMNVWSPISKARSSGEEEKEKPVVVLIHGFAAEGIVTWQFQVGSLTAKYSVYVPDLFFFGGSVTGSAERSPAFQADSVARALEKLGVRRCALVGFSYGGMVAFKLTEMRPQMVSSLVVSGSFPALTQSVNEKIMGELGFSSSSELLLPSSVKGLKTLLSVACYKKLWFPNKIYRDFLEVMFTHRKEREELLEGVILHNKDANIPHFSQPILLLWGEEDKVFNVELAKSVREQLGEKAFLVKIKKAGHLVHLERPCVYNRHLKEFLAFSMQSSGAL